MIRFLTEPAEDTEFDARCELGVLTQFSVDPGRCVSVTLRNLYFDTYRLIRMLTMDL